MPFTADEFKELCGFVRNHMMTSSERHNDSFVRHLMDENKTDLDFRHFIKNHYPEALAEWNALQKIGE